MPDASTAIAPPPVTSALSATAAPGASPIELTLQRRRAAALRALAGLGRIWELATFGSLLTIGGCIAGLLSLVASRANPQQDLVLLGLLAGAGLARLLKPPATRLLMSLQVQLQQLIRTNLLEGGLLRLGLEHGPLSRLPALGRPAWWAWGQPPRVAQQGTDSMADRLQELTQCYAACCRDLKLPAYTPVVNAVVVVAQVLLYGAVAATGTGLFLALTGVLPLRQVGGLAILALLVVWPGTVLLSSMTNLVRQLVTLELDDILNPQESRELRTRLAAQAADANQLEDGLPELVSVTAESSSGEPSSSVLQPASTSPALRDNQADA